MEPETPKPKGSQWFTSFLHDLLASDVQEDGVRHHGWHNFAHLRDGDQYEVGGIQLVRRILTGCRSMPHIQMHVCNAKGLHGNIVRLIHEPHSHRWQVLLIEHTFSCGQNQGLFRRRAHSSLHQIGTSWLREPLKEALQWYSAEHNSLKRLCEV